MTVLFIYLYLVFILYSNVTCLGRKYGGTVIIIHGGGGGGKGGGGGGHHHYHGGGQQKQQISKNLFRFRLFNIL